MYIYIYIANGKATFRARRKQNKVVLPHVVSDEFTLEKITVNAKPINTILTMFNQQGIF